MPQQVPYYPQYHGEVTTPGPLSHMPAFLIQTPHAITWQIFTLPVVRHRRYKARKYGAGVTPADPTIRQPMRVRIPPSTAEQRYRVAAPGVGSATSATGACSGSNRPGGPDL